MTIASTVAEKKESPAKASAAASQPTAQEIEHSHYGEIREKTTEVCQLRAKWVAAKDRAKNAKGEFDGASAELIELIQRGPDMQRKLPLDGEQVAVAVAPPNDAWRKVTLGHLAIKWALVTKLAEHGLENLGQLSDFWKERHVLTELSGIGESKDEAVRDAFSKYGVEHPEVFAEQRTETDPRLAEETTGEPTDEIEDDDEEGDDWEEIEDDDEDDWDGEEDEDDDEL